MVNVMEPPQTVRPQNPPETLEPATNETEKLQVMIDVREVDFTYGDNKVLHNISLQMSPRAVTAFIGPSGCGKTTLLRCINRMNDGRTGHTALLLRHREATTYESIMELPIHAAGEFAVSAVYALAWHPHCWSLVAEATQFSQLLKRLQDIDAHRRSTD